ncbi:MAG: hypothetical protein ACXW3C_06435 [Pyrinomonadaceae bacterium]
MRKLLIFSALWLAAVAVPNQPAKADVAPVQSPECTAAKVITAAARAVFLTCLTTNNNCTEALTELNDAELHESSVCGG